MVSFWKIRNTATSLKYSGKVRHLRGHDGPIHCLAACKPYSIVVTGSSDKTAIIWDTNRFVCMCVKEGREKERERVGEREGEKSG